MNDHRFIQRVHEILVDCDALRISDESAISKLMRADTKRINRKLKEMRTQSD